MDASSTLTSLGEENSNLVARSARDKVLMLSHDRPEHGLVVSCEGGHHAL